MDETGLKQYVRYVPMIRPPQPESVRRQFELYMRGLQSYLYIDEVAQLTPEQVRVIMERKAITFDQLVEGIARSRDMQPPTVEKPPPPFLEPDMDMWRSICQQPFDNTARMIFADWLDERGMYQDGRFCTYIRNMITGKEHGSYEMDRDTDWQNWFENFKSLYGEGYAFLEWEDGMPSRIDMSKYNRQSWIFRSFTDRSIYVDTRDHRIVQPGVDFTSPAILTNESSVGPPHIRLERDYSSIRFYLEDLVKAFPIRSIDILPFTIYPSTGWAILALKNNNHVVYQLDVPVAEWMRRIRNMERDSRGRYTFWLNGEPVRDTDYPFADMVRGYGNMRLALDACVAAIRNRRWTNNDNRPVAYSFQGNPGDLIRDGEPQIRRLQHSVRPFPDQQNVEYLDAVQERDPLADIPDRPNSGGRIIRTGRRVLRTEGSDRPDDPRPEG